MDEDGNYMVFIEIKRDENLMSTVRDILKDIDKLVGIDTWQFQFHGSDNVIEVSKEIL